MPADTQHAGPSGHRRAVVKTVAILIVVIAVLLAFALTLTRRLVDDYERPASAEGTTPAAVP